MRTRHNMVQRKIMKKLKKVSVHYALLNSKKKQLYFNKYKPRQSGSSSNCSTTCSSSSRSSSSSGSSSSSRSSSSLSSESESDSSSSSSLNSSSSVSTSSSSDESTSSNTISTNTTSSSTSNTSLSDSTSTELVTSVPKLLQSTNDTSTDSSLQKPMRGKSVKDLEIVFKPLKLSRPDSPKPYRIEDSPSTSKGCRICVNHLTKNVTEEHVREIFSKYGTIRKLVLPLDVFTKLSRGFSYIEYSTPEEAIKAIKHMNGGQIDGYEIVCAPMPYLALHASFVHHNG